MEEINEKMFQNLLDGVEDQELQNEEEKLRQKNKDAEEARKRREKEAKEKEEAEAQAKLAEEEKEKKAKEEAEELAKQEAEKKKLENEKEQKNKEKVNRLGEQLVDFKKKYPNVDLAILDQDKNFNKFVDGKLLGKKDFTALYEEYLDFTSELSGKSKEDILQNHNIKSTSGTGKPNQQSNQENPDVYSENELEKVINKLPFMHPDEAKKVREKLSKSIDFYEKTKK